jgi:hypothetical protein
MYVRQGRVEDERPEAGFTQGAAQGEVAPEACQ